MVGFMLVIAVWLMREGWRASLGLSGPLWPEQAGERGGGPLWAFLGLSGQSRQGRGVEGLSGPLGPSSVHLKTRLMHATLALGLTLLARQQVPARHSLPCLA